MSRLFTIALCLPAFLLIAARLASAEETERKGMNIDAQPLSSALRKFSEQTGLQIGYATELADGKETEGVAGIDDPNIALEALLAGSGLEYRFVNDRTVVIHASRASGDDDEAEDRGNDRPTPMPLLMAQASETRRNEEVDQGRQGSAVAEQTRQLRIPDEIIVTAQKREQNIQDVPISIVALGSDELRSKRVHGFEDLGLSIPGVTVMDQGTGARRINMRGIGNSFGTSPLVGVYLDEVAVAGVSDRVPDLRVFDLERIEVLRGPQGTLYGQGSVGGTIRYITRDPQMDRFSVGTDVSVTSTLDGAPSQKIQGVVDVPMIDGVLGFRLAGVFENIGGWIDQPAVSQQDINDENVADMRLKGLWRPADALEISAMVNIHRNDAGSTSTGEDEQGNYVQAFGFPSTPSSTDDFDIYSLTVNYEFDTLNLLATTSYFDGFNRIEKRGGPLPVLPPPGPLFNYLLDPYESRTELLNHEIRLSTSGEGPFQLTLGAFYQDLRALDDFKQYFSVAADPEPAGFSGNNEKSLQSWAAFGEASLQLTERTEIGVGLRYFDDKQELTDHVVATTQRETFTSLSPRMFVNIAATEALNWYASIAKGFRSGGFNAFGQEPYDPESVWTYESGVKYDQPEAWVSAELSIFFTDYSDFQINALLETPFGLVTRIANAGDAEIKGVDGKLTWQLGREYTVEVGGSYVDTEVVEINALTASHAVGDPLDNISKYQFYISALRELELFSRPASVRIDYNEKGPNYWRLRNVGPHFVGKSDTINLLNLNLDWTASDHVSLGVFARNILNDRGSIDALAINGDGARMRPRSVGFQVRMAF